jgi:hypothetical protein
MTDSDVLARAAKALREAHTGEREGSGFTRARVMGSLHRERRRRLLRWAVFSPLASVLLVGSAWAESTGKWPVIWQAVASVFVSAPAPELGEPPRALPKPPARPRAEPLAPPADADAGVVPAEGTPNPALEEPAPAPPREARKAARSRPKRRVPAQPKAVPERSVAPEPPPEPARDRELSRFRDAHDLHFGGRAREAIRAYDEYLKAYPNGRFVPEARYNIALDQIKLGNSAAAREALEPFAEGRYGNYRRKEARELLDALP